MKIIGGNKMNEYIELVYFDYEENMDYEYAPDYDGE